MQNPQQVARAVQAAFDDIGGEPLAGSGLEADDSQPEFEKTEVVDREQDTPGEE
jgi:hypothetical protein